MSLNGDRVSLDVVAVCCAVVNDTDRDMTHSTPAELCFSGADRLKAHRARSKSSDWLVYREFPYLGRFFSSTLKLPSPRQVFSTGSVSTTNSAMEQWILKLESGRQTGLEPYSQKF